MVSGVEILAEQRSRVNYNAWKRILKSLSKLEDITTVQRLWNRALDILNGEERGWKQWLPKDLDDGE